MDTRSAPTRRLLGLLLAAGLLLLLDQFADLTATLLSQQVDLSAASWRFGLFGLVASRTSALLVGDVMLFIAVLGLGWRSLLRALGALHVLLAAGLVVALVLFMLDAVQLRASVPAPSSHAFTLAVLRAGFVGFLAAGVVAWGGFAAWRSGGRERKGRGEPTPLVVSQKERSGI